MKKFLVLLSVMLFAVAAFAADWNFYGSARIATWYEIKDKKYNKYFEGIDEDETQLKMFLQSNSRVGAKVKNGNLSGRFEYGTGVNLRLLYGKYNFGGFTMLVGQTYTPMDYLNSNQAWGTDAGLLGVGLYYEGRQPQIKFGFGDFELALVVPKTAGFKNATPDKETYIIPKLEAAYKAKFDMVSLKLSGLYQMTDAKWEKADKSGWNSDTITAYSVAGYVGADFSVVKLGFNASYTVNAGNAGLIKSNEDNIGGFAMFFDDDVQDTNTLMLAAMIGGTLTDMLRWEVGYGYRIDNYDSDVKDVLGWEKDSQTGQAVYAQLPVTLAKGVFIVPEAGIIMLDRNPVTDAKAGSNTYFGAKWQINF
jgi:hypothetical protein